MGSTFGKIFKVTTFGESHGKNLGVVIEGIPAGLPLQEEDIQKELDRRKPSSHAHSTQRSEKDFVEILSGVFEGKSTGTSFCAVVKNDDARSKDYEQFKNVFRPGHADETYHHKYGIRDYRGGGRSSGRETVGRVIAGAIAKKILQENKITIQSFVESIGPINASQWDLDFVDQNPYRFCDQSKIAEIESLLNQLKAQGDTIGCTIGTLISNFPAGIGEPVFDKLNAVIGHGILSIGSVKGIEFGNGFEASRLKGSQNNDHYLSLTNHAGGILGGISNGKPINFKTAIKPPSSIQQPQVARAIDGTAQSIQLTGRFDVCLGPRIVPVIESMTAICLVDLLFQAQVNKLENFNFQDKYQP